MRALLSKVLLGCCCLAVALAADPSIMEIIQSGKKNMEMYRLNASNEYLSVPLTTNSISSTEEVLQTEIPPFIGGKVRKHQVIPDFSAVLYDFVTPKNLANSDSGMLVTKKSYIQKDWCKTAPIVQSIREKGCLPKNVINRFCYGQCNSFFIPKELSGKHARGRKRRPNEWDDLSAFQSCGVCKPKKSAWVQVALHCPGSEIPMRRRRVHKVKQCQCMAANSRL